MNRKSSLRKAKRVATLFTGAIACAGLIGLGLTASPAHAAPAAHTVTSAADTRPAVTHINPKYVSTAKPYIAPGMHSGELFAYSPATGLIPASRLSEPGGSLQDAGGACSAGLCINRQNGGAYLQVWGNTPDGYTNNFWLFYYIGTVTSGSATRSPWPFTDGGGQNSAFNGYDVFNIAPPSSDDCINDGPGTEFRQASLLGCSGTSSDSLATWDVWTTSSKIVGVYLTNNNNNEPYFLTALPNDDQEYVQDGSHVLWTTASGAGSGLTDWSLVDPLNERQ